MLRDILGAEAQLPIMAEECGGTINPFSAKRPGHEWITRPRNTVRIDEHL